MNNDHLIKNIDYAIPIYLDISSDIEQKYRVNTCVHEPQTVEWIESFSADAVFYDIGANVGVFSLIASKRNATTIAFEPNFLNHYKLCRNILLNDLSSRITPLNMALTDIDSLGKFEFYSLDFGDAYSVIDRSRTRYFEGPGCANMSVPCMTLDSAIAMWNLPVPNYIKIDVDGEELGVLLGGKALLRNEKLVSLNVEVNESRPESAKAIDFLHDFGFSSSEKYQDPFPDDPEDFGDIYNYIFWRRHA